jgi:tRNA 2-thiocytidine biosynthesis protein TtcA
MQIKSMLDDWERRNPGKRQVMARALAHVRPSHLMDGELFDFKELALGAPGAKVDGL